MIRLNIIIALLVAALSCFYQVQGDGDKVLMCYVVSWSIYRPTEGKFSMSDIDPYLCTHIIYYHSSLNPTTLHIRSNDNWGPNQTAGNLEKLVGLKKKNPKLKILTSVGGWDEKSELFSKIAECKENRQTFIQSVVKYLREYRLDGVDIDWRHPTLNGGKPEDRNNFPALLEELRVVLDRRGYVLTVRLEGARYVTDPSYDLHRISDAVHYINLKSFGFHGTWEPKTGVYSPESSQNELNLGSSLELLLRGGVARSKLLLGLTTEGNAFIIRDEITDGIYIGRDADRAFTGAWMTQNGNMGFNEICLELTKSRLWTQHWDKASSTPFAIKGKLFTSFDDSRSFEEKLKLMDAKSLGGVSLYSLDMDDFNGLCYNEKFILTNIIKSHLSANQDPGCSVGDVRDGETSILNEEFSR